MDYFGIKESKGKRMCFLVHGGEHILSIDENSAERQDEYADENKQLIEKIENIYVSKKSRLHARFRFNKARREAGQTIAQYEIELRRLAKECDFHDHEDEMILDRLLLTCGDEKLQDEALAKDWDVKTFMKYATMKQDIKAQTDEMRLEESPGRAAYKGARGRSSTKFKMYSFRNTEKIKKVEKTENCRKESTEYLMEKKGITAMEKILTTHKKLFEGIGRLIDPHNAELILTHIQMKSEAEPVVQPPRVIPHHLRERTKKKLDYFVKEGIMSWTESGEPIVYASPLVITPK